MGGSCRLRTSLSTSGIAASTYGRSGGTPQLARDCVDESGMEEFNYYLDEDAGILTIEDAETKAIIRIDVKTGQEVIDLDADSSVLDRQVTEGPTA